MLESTKARFLKQVPCTSMYLPTRPVYTLAGTTFLSEDIKKKYNLQETIPYQTALKERHKITFLEECCHMDVRLLETKEDQLQTLTNIHTICCPQLSWKDLHKQGLPLAWSSLQVYTPNNKNQAPEIS
jgi:hypothetical protein